MVMDDGCFDIDPDKVVTGRTFECCHACGEDITEGEDMPWCSTECLQELSDAWWENFSKIQAAANTTLVAKEGESG